MSDSTAMRRLPAEWEPQSAVIVAWPHEGTDWAPLLADARRCVLDIVRALAPHVTPVIIAPGREEMLRTLREEAPEVGAAYVLPIPTNDTWMRDCCPLTVETGEGAALPLDFTFNGWGLKFPADKDNLVTERAAAVGLFAHLPEACRRYVLEGGAVESDGHGTVMTTSQCLLSPNRNPWLSREDYERELFGPLLGASRVLWLDYGHLAGDDTDSHVDTLARFAPEDTIIYVGPPDDSADEHGADLVAMREQLRSFVTADGLPYNLIELPMADAAYDPDDGHRLPATYANFLVTNGAVLVPAYGNARKDWLAAQMIASAFPGREVVSVDCRALIRQHGSLHCMTMQLPVGALRKHDFITK